MRPPTVLTLLKKAFLATCFRNPSQDFILQNRRLARGVHPFSCLHVPCPATTCILSLFSTANTIRKAHAAPHIYSVSACHEKWAWTSPKCGACDGPCKSSQKDCSEVAWLSHQKLSALNQIRRYVTKRRACHTKPHDTSFKTSKSDSFCSTCQCSGHRALTANHGESNRGRTHPSSIGPQR